MSLKWRRCASKSRSRQKTQIILSLIMISPTILLTNLICLKDQTRPSIRTSIRTSLPILLGFPNLARGIRHQKILSLLTHFRPLTNLFPMLIIHSRRLFIRPGGQRTTISCETNRLTSSGQTPNNLNKKLRATTIGLLNSQAMIRNTNNP